MRVEGLAITEESAGPQLDDALARAKAGRFDGFEELYLRHVGRVFAICLRLTADRFRAEDLTQEVFVRVWKSLHSLREDSDFPAWIGRIAVNAVLSDRRARRTREGREHAVDDLEQVSLSPTRPGAAAGLDLESAISGLPEGARTVFVLHDVEGYRHEEIGRLLGIQVGTSKAQLHRARRLLREALR